MKKRTKNVFYFSNIFSIILIIFIDPELLINFFLVNYYRLLKALKYY